MDFEGKLRFGKAGESVIARWYKRRGFSVLPVYEKQVNEGKGPVLFLPGDAELVAPDLLVYRGNSLFWIEAKRKGAFSWHRKTGRWVTGIDRRHFEDYVRVNDSCGWPVWLLFLHERGRAKGTPPGMCSPTGLFGSEIGYLAERINHVSGPRRNGSGWGKSGMVYWSRDCLKLIDSLENVLGRERGGVLHPATAVS